MKPEIAVEELCQRYRKLYTGAIYDILEDKGLPNQLLSLDIKPLKLDMKVAGPAYTVKGVRRPTAEAWSGKPVDLLGGITPDCVVVYDPGNEHRSGHWGELTSNAAAVKGCQGVVVDGGARDGTKHLQIPNWSCFCRYTSPIEAGTRQKIVAVQKPIFMSGSLTTVVRVEPGDFIFGDLDGVLVVPKALAAEVLSEAETKVAAEDKGREEVRKGVDMREVGRKYGVG